MEPLIPLFWISDDVWHEFQSQGRYHLHAFLPACHSPDSHLVQHLSTSWWSVTFPTCRGRMLGFEWLISHSVHRRATNSATAKGLRIRKVTNYVANICLAFACPFIPCESTLIWAPEFASDQKRNVTEENVSGIDTIILFVSQEFHECSDTRLSD